MKPIERSPVVEQNSKTVLLTLGRLPVALDIARSFAAAGNRVLIAEPTRLHLASMSSAVDRCLRVTSPVRDREAYLTDLLGIINAEGVDLVVPVSEESMYVAALHDAVPTGTAIFSAPQDQMLTLHDKFRFTTVAQSLGLAVPRTLRADDPDAPGFGAARDFVMKPRFSCSGRRVSFGHAGSEITADPDLIVQERIHGHEFGSFGIVRGGRVLANVVYRGTVLDGSVAVAFERVDDAAHIDQWVHTFAAGTGHTGFLAFDFKVGADGRAVALECNPRATSGIHFLAEGAIACAIQGHEIVGDRLRPDARLTESYSCFTVTLGSLLRRAGFRDNWRRLRESTDVTWSRSDPWPFLLMMVNTSRLIGLALATRQTFAAAAVQDIEWRAASPGNASAS